MRCTKLTLVLVLPMLMAQTGGPAPPVTLAKPDPLVARPTTLTLDPAVDHQTKDVLLTLQVPTTDVGAALTFGAISDLPGGATVTAAPLGSPAVERSSDGASTGRVTQRVRLSFAHVPRQMDALDLQVPVRFGKSERAFDLAVLGGSQTPASASLSLQAPSDTRWAPSMTIPITVTAKGAAAPNISLAVGPFTDTGTKRNLPTNFCLAVQPNTPCASTISLAQNESRPLFLIENGGSQGEPGTYSGPIRLLSANGLDANQTISLSATSQKSQLLGLLALVIGVLLSFWLTILIPYRRDRDLALRPFASLSARLAVAATERRGFNCPYIADRSKSVSMLLHPKWLIQNGKLGGKWPPADGMTPDAALLKAHLDAETAKVLAIERLSAEVRAQPAYVGALDAIAAESPFPPVNIDADVAKARGGDPTERWGVPVAPPSLAVIAHRDEVQNVIFWIVTSFLSIALGYTMLISNNPAFGSLSDILAAFLWALGLSAASSKIADMTTGALRTAMRPAAT